MKIILIILFFLALCQPVSAQWSLVSAQLPANNIRCMAVKDNIVAAATSDGIFVSTDSGATMVNNSTGIISPDIKAVCISGQNIICGTPNGIYTKQIGSANWSFTPITDIIYMHQSAFFKYGNKIWIPAHVLCNAYESTDDGLTWHVNSNISGCYSNIIESNNLLFHGAVAVSADGGNTWNSASNGYNEFTELAIMGADQVGRIVISRGIYWAPSFSVLHHALASTTPTWQRTIQWVNQPGDGCLPVWAFAGIDSLIFAAVHVSPDSIMYSPFNGVFVSNNGGYSWYLDGDLNGAATPLGGVTSVVADGKILYAGMANGKIYKRSYATTTSNSEIFTKQVSRIFPNPGTGIFGVTIPQSSGLKKIMVFDVSGQSILSEEFEGEKYLLNIENRQPGLYAVKISDGRNEQVLRVLKQ